jgi:hypothetical protein
MSTAAEANREALIQEALALGFKPDLLQRCPTYTLSAMVQDKRKESHRRKKSPPETQPDLGSVVERLQDRKAEEDFDDKATVVDMEHITSTENPSDQKYKRFSFLICAKNELIAAIQNNTQLLQTHKDKLDPDDIAVIHGEIEKSQYQLNLVNAEIQEIQQWFHEVHVQKQIFYTEFLKNSTDISGELSSHFQRKVDNIQKYMQAMHDTSQLKPQDLP